MTLKQIADALAGAGIDDPVGEALTLAEAFTGRGRALLLCDGDRDIESAELEAALAKRCGRMPLQYILGQWEFMGLSFQVSEACLIPRADTELLCEWAIRRLPRGGTLLDLCTGSGCIAVSAAHYRPDISVTAVDLFPETLAVAEKNGSLLGVADRTEFILADATSQSDFEKHFRGRHFDVIVSNPPYITAGEMESVMPELSHEPISALTDGGDGLSFYRAMTELCPAYLASDGACAFEHGYSQGEAVRALIRGVGYTAETLRDLSGNERVTFFEKKNILK